MRLLLVCFMIVFAGCGVTERVEIIRDPVGCTSDAMCADRDPETTEYCELDSGICVRERVVTAVCETFADCDDGDPTSVDSCDADGVCNHTRDVTAPFDPASPERQDARSLCEASLACDAGDGPQVSISFTTCYGRRDLWSERGYFLMIAIPEVTSPAMLRFRPQMRVGDPADMFRLTVWVGDTRAIPVSVRDLTVAQIEEGFTVNVDPADFTWSPHYVFLTFDFIENAPRSRALQWALPVGGVVNETTGENYVPSCMLVGPFVDVPDHGFLRLTESPATGEPQCTGEVRMDPWAEGATLPDGLFRTVSNPRLYYAQALVSPGRLYQFETLREFIDWWQNYNADGMWHPNTICAGTTVFPDGTLERALVTYEVETLGVRPGTPVTWWDYDAMIQRYGIADRHWTILDVGTNPYAVTRSGYACSWYNVIPSVGRPITDCPVDLAGRQSRYTLVPTDPMTVDPAAITEEWGWFHWYNHDP